MKDARKFYGIALAVTCGLATTLEAQSLYIGSIDSGAVGEYGLNGSIVDTSLIPGVEPFGIAISGNDVFVANDINNTVGEYTTSGKPINAALISGLGEPSGMAIIPVPEPSTVALASLGAVAFCFWWRWR